MSPRGAGIVTVRRGFPRVSGDEPANWTKAERFDGFSPRERG